MKLKDINTDNLTDSQINDIVFSGTDDNNELCDIAIVFGNSDMIKERTSKAVEMYKSGRVKKLLFTGGTGGITNTNHDTVSEAEKMGELAIQLGVKENDIILENQSNNSFENVQFSIEKLKEENLYDDIKSIMIITSDFHLKRCLAIFLQHEVSKNFSLVPVKNGYSDLENWFLSEKAWGTGRGIVSFEAEILVKYAKEDKIYNLDIVDYKTDIKSK